MTTIRILTLLGLLCGLSANVSTASAGGKDCCPRCTNKTCVPVPTKVENKKTCYEVDCKEICIPKARWPWQKCCKPECGRVINVRVLRKVDYKCTSCGYRWEIPGKECGIDEKKLTGAPFAPRPTVAVSTKPATTATVKRASFFDYFKK